MAVGISQTAPPFFFFSFFFSDKRGIKNTHIATWTDGWMDGKLDLPVPASSTPATSKEDYTHIRSF
jgi:hypothetical protein